MFNWHFVCHTVNLHIDTDIEGIYIITPEITQNFIAITLYVSNGLTHSIYL